MPGRSSARLRYLAGIKNAPVLCRQRDVEFEALQDRFEAMADEAQVWIDETFVIKAVEQWAQAPRTTNALPHRGLVVVIGELRLDDPTDEPVGRTERR